MNRDITSQDIRRLHTAIARQRKSFPLVKVPDAFYSPTRDGVTFSVLQSFLQCRELARLGLHGVTSKGTSLSLVFGTVAHSVNQTVYTDFQHGRYTGVPQKAYVMKVLADVEKEWQNENSLASAEALQHLEFSMIMAEAIMPPYFQYWKSDFTDIQWVGIEREFRIPVQVPVRFQADPIKTFIRGKMDGNFRDKATNALKLFETKSKSRIDEETIAGLLPHELQVHIYLWAMRRLHKERPKGVRYNLIRRPGLRQRQAESVKEFAVRCAQDVLERKDFYFVRLDMDVDTNDLLRFEPTFQDLLRDFLEWWYGHGGHYKNSGNCENKYGKCWMLPICGSRDFATFYRRDKVFRELEEV